MMDTAYLGVITTVGDGHEFSVSTHQTEAGYAVVSTSVAIAVFTVFRKVFVAESESVGSAHFQGGHIGKANRVGSAPDDTDAGVGLVNSYGNIHLLGRITGYYLPYPLSADIGDLNNTQLIEDRDFPDDTIIEQEQQSVQQKAGRRRQGNAPFLIKISGKIECSRTYACAYQSKGVVYSFSVVVKNMVFVHNLLVIIFFKIKDIVLGKK